MDSPYYLNFHAAINEQVANKLMAVCGEIVAKHNPPQIYFLFSSPGGSVDSGITLYNFLRALPCSIVMHNTGSIDSIATVVFHAADERYASPQSSFLFHGITWNFNQGQALTVNQLEEVRSILTAGENKIAKLVASKCALSEEELRGLFKQGEAKSAEFALAKGIVREIREAKVPKGAPLFSLNLS